MIISISFASHYKKNEKYSEIAKTKDQHYLCHNPHSFGERNLRFPVRVGTKDHVDFMHKAQCSMNEPLKIVCVNQVTFTSFEVTSHAILHIISHSRYGKAGGNFQSLSELDAMLNEKIILTKNEILQFEKELNNKLDAGFGDFARPDPFNPGTILMSLSALHGYPLFSKNVCAKIEIDQSTGFATTRHRLHGECEDKKGEDFHKNQMKILQEYKQEHYDNFKNKFLKIFGKGSWVEVKYTNNDEYKNFMPKSTKGNAFGGWGLLLFDELNPDLGKSFPQLDTQQPGFGTPAMRKFLKDFFNVELLSIDNGFPFTEKFSYRHDREDNIIMSFNFVNAAEDYVRNFVSDLKRGSGGTFIEAHEFPHIFVTETHNSLGRVVIGRAFIDEGERDKPYDKITHCNLKSPEETTCFFQIIDVHLPFKFGLRIAENVLHGDSATRGRIATPIDVKDESANSALIKLRKDPTELIGFAHLDTFRQDKQERVRMYF